MFINCSLLSYTWFEYRMTSETRLIYSILLVMTNLPVPRGIYYFRLILPVTVEVALTGDWEGYDLYGVSIRLHWEGY